MPKQLTPTIERRENLSGPIELFFEGASPERIAERFLAARLP